MAANPVQNPPPAADRAEILRALSVLFEPDDVVELRMIAKGKKAITAGCFDGNHRDDLVEAAARMNAYGQAVYVTMNPIDPQLLGRYANRVEQHPAATTSDANVLSRRWLLVDIDSPRPAGTSANDAQHDKAQIAALMLSGELSKRGWPLPVYGDSGNGAHLLYRIKLPNDKESAALVSGVLAGLQTLLADDSVKIDQTVFNAARIVKLYGTVANKGDHTPIAPWRLAHLIDVPAQLDVVPREFLDALCAAAAPTPTAVTGRPFLQPTAGPILNSSSFDLNAFLSKLGIGHRQDSYNGSLRIRLDHCPFNSEHGQGEAAIFQRPNGALGFRCQHDSCSEKKWKDLRQLVEPPKNKKLKHVQAANEPGVELHHFYAFNPTHQYIFEPTRELWVGVSVDNRITQWPVDPITMDEMRPSAWLDRYQSVQQMTWHPAEPTIVCDRVVQAGGWVDHPGARVFNLYRAPAAIAGDASQATKWLEHVRRIYPTDADHLIKWLAHRIQRPGDKINHAIVLGGQQGIGKDTLLEPVKVGVGAWNWSEIGPAQMLGRFNPWVKSVVVRLSEARDLGDVDRFAFYDHSKTYTAAPPDVILVDEKNLREHPVANVLGLIITTNHLTDGLYLPADDRRHYVAWSNAAKEEFGAEYWTELWRWYSSGGLGHVVAYLQSLDLSLFDPKAPPPKTQAFHAIVSANHSPDDSELADVIDRAGRPAAVTVDTLVVNAEALKLSDFARDLVDRKSRRQFPHRMERAGYVSVRNPNASDGLWKISGRRQVAYARKGLTVAEQLAVASALPVLNSCRLDQ